MKQEAADRNNNLELNPRINTNSLQIQVPAANNASAFNKYLSSSSSSEPSGVWILCGSVQLLRRLKGFRSPLHKSELHRVRLGHTGSENKLDLFCSRSHVWKMFQSKLRLLLNEFSFERVCHFVLFKPHLYVWWDIWCPGDGRLHNEFGCSVVNVCQGFN